MYPDTSGTSPKNLFLAELNQLITESTKTDAEIAREIGYERPNVVIMIRKGVIRLPLVAVVPLAIALGVDPGALLREWFDTYQPKLLPLLEAYLYPRG